MDEAMFQPGELLETAVSQQAGSASIPEPADDWQLVTLLRDGDEAAFVFLITSYLRAMLHLAMLYVARPMVAEEVVQETWMAVLESLPRFEGRSSLKTWIFRILTNRAKTRAAREGRSVPFASLADLELDVDEPAVEAERFRPPGAQWAGGWLSFPAPWEGLPEERLLSQETRACLQTAIEALPPGQRAIITLCDIESWSAAETSQPSAIGRARSSATPTQPSRPSSTRMPPARW